MGLPQVVYWGRPHPNIHMHIDTSVHSTSLLLLWCFHVAILFLRVLLFRCEFCYRQFYVERHDQNVETSKHNFPHLLPSMISVLFLWLSESKAVKCFTRWRGNTYRMYVFGGDFVTDAVSKYRGERILKIGPHLAKLRQKYSSSLWLTVTSGPVFCATFFVSHFCATLFFVPPYCGSWVITPHLISWVTCYCASSLLLHQLLSVRVPGL